MNKPKSSNQSFKPSDYLRARRPERYSDSVVTEAPKITQDILEYHLNSLTSRSQEKEFEYFARRLAEKEICPNLIPQTGPTGGGDSKVDSETYPVSEEISMRWYQGNASASERWAFAISAKEKWKPKAKDDVKKIAETNRGYSLIYFVTNQFVRDKARAETEGQLKDEFGIAVRILDRNWIVDKIINNNRIDLAAETLSIESLKFNPIKKMGPLDSQRESVLTELEAEINDTDRYLGVAYQLAEDCLRAAVIASELERDRLEVDGRFSAALRIAESVGDSRQILRVIYRHAWISCFVYDDVAKLSRLYDEVEKLGLSSQYADDVEKVNNLWSVLVGSGGHDNQTWGDLQILNRSNKLTKRLEELSNDNSRPNNALQAKTLLLIHKLSFLLFTQGSSANLDSIFKELEETLVSSRGLGAYPFESYKEILFELGNFFPNNEAVDNLLDTLVDIVEKRTSEGEAGSALTNRGIQKLKNDKPYDAIRLFGKAQDKLVKEEYKFELIKSLVACGSAYRSTGLLWAARVNLLAAISYCITDFKGTGSMYRIALPAAQELTWIELELGRALNAVCCIQIVNFIANQLQLNEADQRYFLKFYQDIDAVFSVLLLKLNIEQLGKVTKMPHIFDKLGLVCSEGTLIFALGHIEKLKRDVWFNNDQTLEDIEKFYELVSSQPANDQLPSEVQIYTEKHTELRSNVLGVNLVFEVDTNIDSILIAESFLGALESFLATSLRGGIYPYKSDAKIAVRLTPDLQDNVGMLIEENSNDYDVEIKHRKGFSLSSKDDILKFRDILVDFIASLLSKISMPDDNVDLYIKNLAENEGVFGRSTIFSDVPTLNGNIFDGLEWFDISIINESIDGASYDILRTSQWLPRNKTEFSQMSQIDDERPARDKFLDSENFRHNERKILSLIDIPVWDKADWCGTFFMMYHEADYPPSIGFVFREETFARKIFENWIKRFGNIDKESLLRVALITGLDKKHATHYAVHIGTNVELQHDIKKSDQLIMVSRYCRMKPPNSANLDNFLGVYKKYNTYYLLPAVLKNGEKYPKPIEELAILKQGLVVKPAWEIHEHDQDLIILSVDDEPVIPAGIKNAPIIKALEKISQMKAKRHK